MEFQSFIHTFWRHVAAQDAAALEACFVPEAVVQWHNTNERFNAAEYIRANCEYPGQWRGEVERIESFGDAAVSVARVWLADGAASFHAVSFYRFSEDRILRLDEYWGDDGAPPQWRKDKRIGTPIRQE